MIAREQVFSRFFGIAGFSATPHRTASPKRTGAPATRIAGAPGKLIGVKAG